jgi:hypothetical protein
MESKSTHIGMMALVWVLRRACLIAALGMLCFCSTATAPRAPDEGRGRTIRVIYGGGLVGTLKPCG